MRGDDRARHHGLARSGRRYQHCQIVPGTEVTAGQAAAVLSALTDGKRVSVINAPAGSGKTRVMTEAGITPSQSAGNTLATGDH